MGSRKNDGVVTIKDIATICGVSISTVSNVLNNKSKKVSKEVADRIHEVVEQTGYRPNYLAKNLRALSTRTIGVIAEDLNLFSTAPIIEGLMQYCEEKGYSVVIENMRLFGRWDGKWMHDDALFQSALEPVVGKMDAIRVDGIIYVSSYDHIVNFSYNSDEVPIVFVYATNDDGKTPSFRLDDDNGGYEMFRYLLNNGHKKIGIITGEAENPHTVNRLRGVQRAMFEAGILYDPSLVEYQTWNKQGGYNGAQNLLKHDITALMCMSDMIASGVYEYMFSNDKKPGRDIAIVGYDNHDISEMLYPQLTTMRLPLEKMGYESVAKLIEMIEDGKEESGEIDFRIAGEIIERDSVFEIM